MSLRHTHTPSAETAPFPGLVEASAASSSPFKRVACDGEMKDFRTTQPSALRAFATLEAAVFFDQGDGYMLERRERWAKRSPSCVYEYPVAMPMTIR